MGSLLLALLLAVTLFRGIGEGWPGFLTSLAWAYAITVTQWAGHRYIYELMDRRISWRNEPVKRAILGGISIILYAVVAYLVVHITMYRLIFGALPGEPVAWALRSSYVAVLISFAVAVVSMLIGFISAWKRSVLDAENYEKELLRYRLESLQKQINPHFLFNSFNVLSDLVYEDRDKAVAFIGKLSQLFRYVLDNSNKELVTMGEEVDFAQSYLFLLQTRFEDKLQVELDVEARNGEMLVPMTLQLLIENGVKHNEISAERPLKITISRKGDYITVENNLQPRSGGESSTGKGLSNLIQQYQYFTERTIRQVETDHLFRVEVPVLQSQKE